jgi:hypothetical protein
MALETDKQRGFVTEFQELWASIPSKAVFGVLFAAWFALFHFLGNSTFGYFKTPSVFKWLYGIYESAPDDSLGTLIPFAVLALFWWKREALVAAPKRIWWPALAIFVLALGFHLVGYTVQQTRVSILAFFVGLYALMGLVWGPAWLRATFFPFILFAFMMPMTAYAENLTTSLRQLSTVMTVAISDDILGIKVIGSGTQIFDQVRSLSLRSRGGVQRHSKPDDNDGTGHGRCVHGISENVEARARHRRGDSAFSDWECRAAVDYHHRRRMARTGSGKVRPRALVFQFVSLRAGHSRIDVDDASSRR